MPCEPIIEKGKVTGWICSRSRGKQKPPSCYKCGKPATKLCDFRDYGIKKSTGPHGDKYSHEWASLDTCDKPMCGECANLADLDTHYCDQHNDELSRYKTRNAERVHAERIKRLGIEEEL